MAELYALTRQDVDRLRDLLHRIDDMPDRLPPPPEVNTFGEQAIFGKLQSAMSAVASSGGSPTSGTLVIYKFTTTGGTTSTGETETVYNLTLATATTIGWVTAKRESRSGNYLMQAFTASTGTTESGGTAFLIADLTTTMIPTVGSSNHPAINNIIDASGTTQAAIGSSRLINDNFHLFGKTGDEVLLLPWGTQSTTTGGSETIYQIVQVHHTLYKPIRDVRITTGSSNLLEGLQITAGVPLSSTAGTWITLDTVVPCSGA